MKIQVMSDVHLEFHRDHGEHFFKTLDNKDVDVLVLAGDIVPLRDHYWSKQWLTEFCSLYKHVVYCQGNHEYYNSSPGEADHSLGAIRLGLDNLHVLEHGLPTTIDGQRFIGGTMWFRDDIRNSYHKMGMNDFYVISQFTPWVYQQNAITLKNLEQHLQKGDFVVTHHLPSDKSVHPKFQDSSLNRFFVCDVEQLILDKQPLIWAHGHTHEGIDYKLGETRVVANPMGYPHETISVPFNPKLVIET